MKDGMVMHGKALSPGPYSKDTQGELNPAAGAKSGTGGDLSKLGMFNEAPDGNGSSAAGGTAGPYTENYAKKGTGATNDMGKINSLVNNGMVATGCGKDY